MISMKFRMSCLTNGKWKELRERLAEGLQYFKWGQHTEALTAFEAALEIDPHSKAHLFVDKIHRMAGR